jgi:hypothetical protein
MCVCVCVCGVNSPGSGYGIVTFSCKHVGEPLDSGTLDLVNYFHKAQQGN